ncbi:hypothetical protein NQ318_011497, partial [Aromia moschata]
MGLDLARPKVRIPAVSAGHSHNMWKEVSSSSPHLLQSGSFFTPIVADPENNVRNPESGDTSWKPGVSGISTGFSKTNLIENNSYLSGSQIELYVETESEKITVESKAQLVGHEDWIRGMDFTLDESILTGHEGWIYSVNWCSNSLQLLSASIDKSMIIWEFDKNSGLDTSNWKQTQKLMSHTLTVVQLQFSPDSNHLLSVSRDRRWSLFTRNEQDQFELVATTTKSTGIHARIIWACCWSHDSKYFATGSRDGKVVVWTVNEEKEKTTALGQCEAASTVLELPNESVTAVAFAPDLVSGAYLVAVGVESGEIRLYKWVPEQWKEVLVLSK